MFQIWAIFLIMLLVVFSIVMLATSPTAKETAIARRLREILTSQTGSQRAVSKPSEAMPPTDQKSQDRVRSIIRDTKLAGVLQKLILQSHVRTSVKVILQIMLAFACATYCVAWHLSEAFALSLAFAAAAGSLPLAYLYYRRKKWLTAFNAALPECIETFARSLRAGHSIVAGLDIVAKQVPAPANAEFADVFKKQRYGLPLREALYQMIERVPSMDLKIMVTAVLVQRETGGNLPNVFDRLVMVIRDRLRIQRDIRTYTAQGRFTGWILGLLPPFLMLAINVISPNYSQPFIHNPIGRWMLCSGVALLSAGVLMIRRIVHGIEV